MRGGRAAARVVLYNTVVSRNDTRIPKRHFIGRMTKGEEECATHGHRDVVGNLCLIACLTLEWLHGARLSRTLEDQRAVLRLRSFEESSFDIHNGSGGGRFGCL
jgi:hypothetical protein